MPRARKSKPLSPDHAALGKAIEAVMKKSGATQDDVADRSGMDIRRVRALIHGQGNPTYLTLVKLCRGLKVRPGELMSLADKYRRKG
jgi:transcriptional regulator with XRE-family HTH domain